jgi:hypothetical protein
MAKDGFIGVVKFMKVALKTENSLVDPLKVARYSALIACLSASNVLAMIDLSCSGHAEHNGNDAGYQDYRIQILKTPSEQNKATMYIWGLFAGGEHDPLGWFTKGSEINEGEETYFPSDYPQYMHRAFGNGRVLKMLTVDRYDLTFDYGVTAYDGETAEPSFWYVEGKCRPYVEREFKI